MRLRRFMQIFLPPSSVNFSSNNKLSSPALCLVNQPAIIVAIQTGLENCFNLKTGLQRQRFIEHAGDNWSGPSAPSDFRASLSSHVVCLFAFYSGQCFHFRHASIPLVERQRQRHIRADTVRQNEHEAEDYRASLASKQCQFILIFFCLFDLGAA